MAKIPPDGTARKPSERESSAAYRSRKYAEDLRKIAERAREGVRKPDWGKWGSFVEALPDQALALSLNVDPDAMRPGYLVGDRLREYQERRATMANHIQAQRLAVIARTLGTFYVRLTDFAVWADGVGWSLPLELRKLLPPPAAEAGAKLPAPKSKGSTTKETATLLTMIYALAKIAEIDTTRPSKAAKAILRALDGEGVKIGQRTVEEFLKRIPDALDRKGF